jgi:hypothetical protein
MTFIGDSNVKVILLFVLLCTSVLAKPLSADVSVSGTYRAFNFCSGIMTSPFRQSTGNLIFITSCASTLNVNNFSCICRKKRGMIKESLISRLCDKCINSFNFNRSRSPVEKIMKVVKEEFKVVI